MATGSPDLTRGSGGKDPLAYFPLSLSPSPFQCPLVWLQVAGRSLSPLLPACLSRDLGPGAAPGRAQRRSGGKMTGPTIAR